MLRELNSLQVLMKLDVALWLGQWLAAAVILPKLCKIKGLNDSKKIPKSKHEAIYKQVMKEAVAVGIGIKDNHVIDDVNIYEATKLAMTEAIEKLSPKPEQFVN